MHRLYINSRYAQLLAQHQLDSYPALQHGTIPGEIIAQDSERSTWRIALGDQRFYLKRVIKFKWRSALEAILKLQLPHHYCWREMQQIQFLQEAAVAVMEVAAAGESLRLGLPTSSFILVREIEGELLDKLFGASGSDDQRQMLQDLGKLAGQLHNSGFFAPVRMKDVIRQADGQLVLIDRETRNPKPSSFNPARATRSLGKMLFRQSRDGIQWSREELLLYLQAYHQATAPRLQMGVEQLLQQCLQQQRKQSR